MGRRGPRRAGAWLAVILVAAAVRLWPWPAVFTPAGVRLTGDDDVTYHVLRAERLLAGAPGAPWRDPGLNHPHGADVPWPPLFDAGLAGGARLLAAGGPVTRSHVELAAAVLPVLLGLATLPLVALLAEALLGGGGLLAALLLALLPGHAVFSMLGRGDQHVAELWLACAAFLAMVAGLRRPEGPTLGPRLALAVALAAALWTWTGGALLPAFLALFTGAWFTLAPAGDRAAARAAGDLAAGGLLGAGLVAAALVAARGPGALASLALAGVTGLHVLLLVVTGAYGVLLRLAARRPALAGSWPRRLASAGAAGALLLLVAWAVPGFSAGAGRGLTALARASAWYRNVQEFDPLVLAGFVPLSAELRELVALYGLTLLALPLAALPLWRRWRASPAERPSLAFLLAWTATFLLLGFLRKRFALYLVAPLAVVVGQAWGGWAEAAARRLGGGAAARAAAGAGLGLLLLGPALLELPDTLAGEPAEHAELRALLERTRALPLRPGRHGLLAEWSYGHLAQLAAGRPVLVSPFGIEGGDGAMEHAAALFLESDPERAEAHLARREVGLVVLGNPLTEVHFAHAFAPPGTPEYVAATLSARTGARVTTTPGFWLLPVVRLYLDDGVATDRAPALAGFRLVDESQGVQPFAGRRPARFKVFEPVAGARVAVRGARPGRPVTARAVVTTAAGRRLEWWTWGTADGEGVARLRLPYATGANGTVSAGPYGLAEGAASATLRLAEPDVVEGREREARLAGGR